MPWDDLSPRVQMVARLAADGHTHETITSRLELAPATVRNQRAPAPPPAHRAAVFSPRRPAPRRRP